MSKENVISTNKEKPTFVAVYRLVLFSLCLLFCIVTAIVFFFRSEPNKALMALASLAFVVIPNLAEKLFRFRIQPILYLFVMIYTICPLLGYSYKLYYLIRWWDDLLHGFAGVLFAMFGAYLPKAINKNAQPNLALCALFGFAFSVMISGLWECVEYGFDTAFGTDMQKDSWLTTMRPSYLLGELFGLPTGEMADLGETYYVSINGQMLPGHLDVGLIDTMTDILVETAGALVYTAIYIFGQGKFFVFEPLDTNEPTKEPQASQTETPVVTQASQEE